MPLRLALPPLLIWRTITVEFGRVLVMTLLSLLTVIAFAGAVKPLAEGQIGLGDALVLTLLLSVPMLQFALPFAAGFASTIAYHRFASDNEAVAAASAGISHRSLLAPSLIAGTILASVLAVLSSETIPSFLGRAESLIHRDVARVLAAQIDKGGPIRIMGHDVYAERAIALDESPAPGAIEHLVLFGVLAVKQDEDGPGISYHNAQRVDVLLFEDPTDPSATAVRIRASQTLSSSESGGLSQDLFSTNLLPLGSRVGDDPKFLGFRELIRLRDEPRRAAPVAQRCALVSAALAENEMIAAIRVSLETTGRVVLHRDAERFEVVADALEPTGKPGEWRLATASPDAPVTVGLTGVAGLERTQRAAGAVIRFPDRESRRDAAIEEATDPTRRLEMRLTGVVTLDQAASGERAQITYADLAPLIPNAPDPETAPSAESLLAAASAATPESDALANDLRRAASDLGKRVTRLRREITSKIHERIAYAVACLVMVLTGSVVALRMRDALPLTVYLWSFFPALLAVITISTGQRMMEKHGDLGLIVLWSGVAALIVYTAFEAFRLRRH